MNNADLPAMPVIKKRVGLTGETLTTAHGGLTKREYFAALAMQGLLAGGYCIDDPMNRTTDPVSEAVVLADNLLAELDKEAA